uniref:Chromo domain-containing protein n=1 Tax=Brassica oleracea var. oleracea TaxID=109376 RepID=A0A0D3A8N6_BRAOL
MFHISQLKFVVGSIQKVNPFPSTLSVNYELIVEPEELLDKRYDELGHLDVLIKWTILPTHETIWMRMKDRKHQFPNSSTADKLVLPNRGLISHGKYIHEGKRR